MSDALPIAPAAVAPTNGAHPTTPQKPAVVKPTTDVKAETKAPEVDDSEEYVIDGKATRLTKAQRQLHFAKGLAADKRFKEAADERNKAAELLKLWETDPDAALRKLGRDPDKERAAHLERRAKLELMTQEQRDAEALKSRAEAAEAKAAKLEADQKAARQAELDDRNFKAIQTKLIAAADKHGLSDSPDVLTALCDIKLEFLEHGMVADDDQVAEEYLRREREHIEAKDKKLLSVLKGKKLLDYLGDATLSEVKAALAQLDTDSLKDIPKPQAKPKTQVRAHERALKGPHISEGDFDKKFKL